MRDSNWKSYVRKSIDTAKASVVATRAVGLKLEWFEKDKLIAKTEDLLKELKTLETK